MARRVVAGALRATCVLASAATRTIVKMFSNPAEHQRANSASQLLEPLEGRQLLASVSLSDGVLSVGGDAAKANTITVTSSGSNYVAKVGSLSKTYSAASVKSIRLYGGDLNDKITIATSVTKPSIIDGRFGNDLIKGGNGADKVYGDKGNDTIYGNGGNDSLAGEAGNDYLDGGAGTDVLAGGEGANTLKSGEDATANPKPNPAPSPGTSASVSAIELWDVAKNKKIQNITAGSTLDLAKLPAKLAIVAVGTGGSVKFGYDAKASYRIETAKPWSISGEVGGKLAAFNLTTGSHKITVTPYTKGSATGSAGAAKTVSFTVKRSTTPAPVKPKPPAPAPAKPPAPAPSTGTGGISPRNNNAAAPDAVITAVAGTTIHAGHAFHGNAMSSALKVGTPITARYVWNFGDAGSRHNVMEGFNAAHYYDAPGTYTVSLTVTNEAGKSDTVTTKVNITADGRKTYYVSSAGSDSNDGLSTGKAFKTFEKAMTKAGDNTEILFERGDTFNVAKGKFMSGDNIVLGAYGSGSRPVLKYTGKLELGQTMVVASQGTRENTVRDIAFDSIYPSGYEGMPSGFSPAGTNCNVINCEFLNVGDGVNSNRQPVGVLVQDNVAPKAGGVRGYFAWVEGKDHTYVGNSVADSRYQHVIRVADFERVNISDNTFTNIDQDVVKGTITVHKGQYAYVRGNTLHQGMAALGPLGGGDGKNDKGGRTRWVVFENNVVNSALDLAHGLERAILRNNVFRKDNGITLEINGFNAEYGRGLVDLTIVNNTGINNGQQGSFLRLEGAANGINLINNLYVAPKFVTGGGGASAVSVVDNDLSSFTKITGNVWPMPTMLDYAQGGINYVYTYWSNSAGYRTPGEWNAFAQVGDDHFVDTTVSGYNPASSSKANGVGLVWAGVFTDLNGKVRSNGGAWTAGAVEV